MKQLVLLSLLQFFFGGVIASASGDCGNCIFPFIFNGRIFNTRTTIDGDATPWCATSVDEQTGGFNSTHTWEYCESTCPGVSNPSMIVDPLNAVGSCFCGVPNKMSSKRIVGGVETDIGEYPWQVALLLGGSESLQQQACGGALVGDQYVVTAAHCTIAATPGSVKVVVGDTTLAVGTEASSFIIGVKTIKNHPNYDKDSKENDISILELETPVSLTDYPNIKPICLPSKDATYAGLSATISGWGRVGSGESANSHLHEVDVTVFADGNCGAMNTYMTDDMICAGLKEGGKDSCQGDSGGPLFTQDPSNNSSQTLIGVVSWGIGCALEDRLGIYAEVSHFRDWLDKELSEIVTCSPPSDTTTPTTNCLKVNKVPVLKATKKIKKVKTAESCQKQCQNDPDCERFKWKDHKSLKKRLCILMKLGFKAIKNWVSGPKQC